MLKALLMAALAGLGVGGLVVAEPPAPIDSPWPEVQCQPGSDLEPLPERNPLPPRLEPGGPGRAAYRPPQKPSGYG